MVIPSGNQTWFAGKSPNLFALNPPFSARISYCYVWGHQRVMGCKNSPYGHEGLLGNLGNRRFPTPAPISWVCLKIGYTPKWQLHNKERMGKWWFTTDSEILYLGQTNLSALSMAFPFQSPCRNPHASLLFRWKPLRATRGFCVSPFWATPASKPNAQILRSERLEIPQYDQTLWIYYPIVDRHTPCPYPNSLCILYIQCIIYSTVTHR